LILINTFYISTFSSEEERGDKRGEERRIEGEEKREK
jgi:hypothetical protein